MKALSVRAPWWWAILHGKPIENRDWATRLRGRVYLHAGKWWKQAEIDDDLEDIREMAEADAMEMPAPDLAAMRAACGCIVGTVEIVDCVRDHLSAFFVGEYGFVLRDPIAIAAPIPFVGALGFFDVPDRIEANPVTQYYTKATVSATAWCAKCGKETLHRVHDGRIGSCEECLARLEKQAAEPRRSPPAEQASLFGGKE